MKEISEKAFELFQPEKGPLQKDITMKKEYDFSKLKKRDKVKVDMDATKVPISIRLDAMVLSELKTMSERLGIPYQTFISSILFRFVTGELVDKKDEQIKKEIRSLLREALKDSSGR